jgi:hypothetical protein
MPHFVMKMPRDIQGQTMSSEEEELELFKIISKLLGLNCHWRIANEN